MYSVLETAGRAVPLTVAGALGAFVVGWALATNLPGPTTAVNAIALGAATLVFAAIAVSLGALLYDLLTRPRSPHRAAPQDDTHETNVMEVLG